MARSRRKTRAVEDEPVVEEVKTKAKKIRKERADAPVPEPPAPDVVDAAPPAEERVTRMIGKRPPGQLAFRLTKGSHLEGGKVYRAGDQILSFRNLDEIWPGRFVRVVEAKLSYNPAKAPPVK